MKNNPQFPFIVQKRSNIPSKFLPRIGELQNCEVVESITLVLQRLKKLEISSNNTLEVLVSQAWPEEGLIFVERATIVSLVILVSDAFQIPISRSNKFLLINTLKLLNLNSHN